MAETLEQRKRRLSKEAAEHPATWSDAPFDVEEFGKNVEQDVLSAVEKTIPKSTPTDVRKTIRKTVRKTVRESIRTNITKYQLKGKDGQWTLNVGGMPVEMNVRMRKCGVKIGIGQGDITKVSIDEFLQKKGC